MGALGVRTPSRLGVARGSLGGYRWRLGCRGGWDIANGQLKTDDRSLLRIRAEGLPGRSFNGCAVTLYCTLVYPAARTGLSTTRPDAVRC
jgi:hypothetical protein